MKGSTLGIFLGIGVCVSLRYLRQPTYFCAQEWTALRVSRLMLITSYNNCFQHVAAKIVQRSNSLLCGCLLMGLVPREQDALSSCLQTGACQSSSHLPTIRFRILPGTKMIVLRSLPSVWARTLSSAAIAAASASSLPMSFGTSTVPRILPFT